MIERYTRKEIGKIWLKENKYKVWLKVEILAVEALCELGIVKKEELESIKKNAKINIKRIEEIENNTKHDVIAFTRAISETLKEEKKWIHYGLTSTDVVDTSLGYLIKQSNNILRKDIKNIINTIKEKSINNKYTVCIGRTHGIHAEPTTFGFKLAIWYEEMLRNLQRFENACKNIECGKISGAVGTYANIDPFIENYICQKLELSSSSISNQILQRDRHAEYISVLCLIATSIEKFATEIRHLQKSEVREVEEYFYENQKGSSAMPHKRNPISSENITGLVRIIRGYMLSAYENVSLWHERDISHSSAERIIIPDTIILLDYILNKFNNIIKNLTIFKENMKKNMEVTYNLIYSQRILLKLIEKGLSREKAYDKVQNLSMKAWDNKINFSKIVKEDNFIKNYLTDIEIKECFDYKYHLRKIDIVFNRLGLK